MIHRWLRLVLVLAISAHALEAQSAGVLVGLVTSKGTGDRSHAPTSPSRTLLARFYPFETTFDRTVSNETRDRPELSRVHSRAVIGRDSIDAGGEHAWRYAPGELVVPTTGTKLVDAKEKMRIPLLADFADEQFVASHCFRFSRLETADSLRVARVDVEPIAAYRKTDMRGTLFLDTQTYAICRSTLLFSRPSPTAPANERWDVRVDTWYSDLIEGLSAIDHVRQMTTAWDVGRNAPIAIRAAVEEQRALGTRFWAETRRRCAVRAVTGISSSMKAILLIDHGSRRDAANEMMDCMANLVQAMAGPAVIARYAHMELAEPSIESGLRHCVEAGATEVICFPYMLSPGKHSTGDIPRMVAAAAAAYPGLQIQVTKAFGVHEKLAELILLRAGLAASESSGSIDASHCWHSSQSGTACGDACRCHSVAMAGDAIPLTSHSAA